ncbi:MAG: transketolase [Cyanobium sp.]
MSSLPHIIADQIRALSLQLVHHAKASHIGSALSIADLLGVLISDSELCRLSVSDDCERDRVILSKGHACVSFYSALHIKGFFSRDELFTYGKDFSSFMNHVSHHVPGVEFSTGALGHGLPLACGKALAAKISGKSWFSFVIMSDGEIQEGSNWEAFLFAAHHQLSNVIALIDYNNLQSLTTVDETISLRPLDDKLKAFGWHVQTINGHDHEAIKTAILTAKAIPLPTAVILKTIKGKGVSFMENQVAWHYKTPNSEELRQALGELHVS